MGQTHRPPPRQARNSGRSSPPRTAPSASILNLQPPRRMGVPRQTIVAGGSDANAVVLPYRHTIAEQHAALRAMLADLDVKLKPGERIERNLDPSIRNIRI